MKCLQSSHGVLLLLISAIFLLQISQPTSAQLNSNANGASGGAFSRNQPSSSLMAVHPSPSPSPSPSAGGGGGGGGGEESSTTVFSKADAVAAAQAQAQAQYTLSSVGLGSGGGGGIPADSMALTLGQVVESYVAQANTRYFYVPLASAAAGVALDIIVTPLGEGDPDLLVDLTDTTPGFNAQFTGTGIREDAVTVPSADWAGKTNAYIGVYGWRNVNFTIVARTNEVVDLLEGVPQSGTVTHGAVAQYTISLVGEATAADLTVSATPLQGSVKIFVSGTREPVPTDPSTYDWSSVHQYSGEALVIHKTDGSWPASGKFWIGVQGTSHTTTAAFSLVAASDASTILLRDGIPQREHLETNEAEYFKISVANPGCSLVVSVTPLSGDPDLYMSTTNPRPTLQDSEKQSMRFGADELSYDPAPPNHYYAGVSAWRNSTFIITAVTSCVDSNHTESITYLIDGVPQEGALKQHDKRIYAIDTQGHHSDLTISLSVRYGDPDLYVTTSASGQADPKNPGPSNYIWRSTAAGEDFLWISAAEAASWCTSCTFYIAVYEAVGDSSYSLTASTSDSIITLQNGIAVRDRLLSHHFAYFQLAVDNTFAGSELTITVTDLSRGDPDLFVSTTNQHPNRTHHMWAAQNFLEDSLTIPHTASGACNGQIGCTYYIAVFGFSNTSFTLVATFENSTRLNDGQPQGGQVATGATRFYHIQVPSGHSDLTVTLTSLSGLNSLYVRKNDLPDINDRLYDWEVPWWEGVKQLTIAESDPKACHEVNCYYYFAVFGVSNSSYSLVAATSEVTIPLLNGVPQQEHIETGGWEYFSVIVESSNQDLAVMVTPITGDPDLVIARNITRPDLQHYDKISNHFGADVIDVPNAQVGTYYIGVTAFRNSTFSITALVTDSNGGDPRANVIRLADGQPQAGSLFTDHYRYYQFEVLSDDLPDILFTVTKQFGDPDLVISLGEFPTVDPGGWQWASMGSQTDQVRILKPAAGTYIIGVYAYKSCDFSITASSASFAIALQDGWSLRGELALGESQLYKLPVDNPDNGFTVSVTPFTGDCDLYMSVESYSMRPNRTHYQWKAAAYAGDSITVNPTDPRFCLCRYFISVYASSACTYSISASSEEASSLVAGSPVQTEVDSGAWKLFRFDVQTGHTDVSFALTPISGNPILAVSTARFPDEFHHQWLAGGNFAGGSIVVRQGDLHYCNHCTYYVGVHTRSAPSTFTLTASTSQSTTELQNGVPIFEWVEKDQYEYFMFEVPQQESDDVTVVFTVTPKSGDPDIFVSSIYPHPNTTNAQWSSRSVGADAVLIPHAGHVTYYVGILAYRNATFTITARMEDPNDVRQTTLLVLGVPQSGVLIKKEFHYYHVTIDAGHRDLTFTTNRATGDPDIYCLKSESLSVRPNTTLYDWKSAKFGFDILSIPNPAAGRYICGVFAFSDTQYSITASTDGAILQLDDGRSFSSNLNKGEYQYFSIFVDRTDMDLIISVTDLSGDPSLFVSDGSVQRPNKTAHTWSRETDRGEVLTIRHQDLKLWTTYGISVYAASTNVSFTIVATFQGENVLQPGVPQYGTLQNQEARYFRLQLGNVDSSVTISLTPFSGEAWLFVGKNEQPKHDDPNTYDAAATGTESIKKLVLRRGDAGFCDQCSLHILVWGASDAVNGQEFSFTLSASLDIVILQDGIPASSQVGPTETKYFVFTLRRAQADLSISLEGSGDPDLYVSTTDQKPSAVSNQWKHTDFGPDTLHIDFSDPNYVLGDYYIGVYGWRNSTFTVTASVTDINGNSSSTQSVLLINGHPQTGLLLGPGSFRYYQFFAGGAANVTFRVTPLSGDPDLYIRNDGQLPTRTFWQWQAWNWGSDVISITDGCTFCTYDILVVADRHTTYSIVASYDGTNIQLQDGLPLQGFVEKNDYDYYSIYVDRTGTPLSIELTAVGSGDPDLMISHSVSQPTIFSPDTRRSQRVGSDQITVENAALGWWYIGVRGFRTSSYTIAASLGMKILVAGQPLDDTVGFGQTKLFAFRMFDPSRSQDLVIRLAQNGNSQGAQMYILNNGSIPTTGSHFWSTLDPEYSAGIRGSVLIRPQALDSRACSNCTYLIAVVGFDQAAVTSFTLTASIGDATTAVVAGKPVTAGVDLHKWVYFRAFVDSGDNDINIDVTTFVGDPDIYASRIHQRPNRTAWEWKSDQTHSVGDHLSIAHTDPKFKAPAIYYIGIYGFEKSSFSLTVTTANILLFDGAPQASQISSEGSSYFVFDMDGSDSDVTIAVASGNTVVADPLRQQYLMAEDGTHAYLKPIIRLQQESSVAIQASNVYDVYVTTNSSFSKPSKDHFMWYRRLQDGQMLIIPKASPNFCSSCAFYVGVYGTPGDKFTVKASTDDAYEILLDDNPHVHGLARNGAFKYYEMFVQSGGNFSVTLEPCTADVSLYVSYNSFRPDYEHFDWQRTEPNSIKRLTIKDDTIQQSSFYIGVVGPSVGDAEFKISAHTTGVASVAPRPGAQGLIAAAAGPTSVTLTFTPASSIKGSSTLSYTIYYAEQVAGAIMYSECGLRGSASRAIKWSNSFTVRANDEQVSKTITGLKKDTIYTFNVIVVDGDGEWAVYDVQQGVKTNSKAGSGGGGFPVKLVLGIGIPVGVLVLAFIVYLLFKNRRLTQELDIEMHDVPKAAVRKAMRGPPSARAAERGANQSAKKYSQLLQAEEEEEDPGEGFISF